MPIYKRPSQIERNRGKAFCSPNCYGISCRKEVPCIVCAKKILAGLHKKTCSRSCSNKNREGIKYKIGRPGDRARSARILKLRLMEDRGKNCERCNYNKYEILQVHHKNRQKTDNRIENLEIICPNCHYEEHFLEKSWLNKKFD
ncbi:MAG: HNH endonuclease signature motif containing protein [Candidatus Paceibacterota bacterium]